MSANRRRGTRAQPRILRHSAELRRTATNPGARRPTCNQAVEFTNTGAFWQAGRRFGEHRCVLGSTVACLHAPSYDCQYSRVRGFTSACVHIAVAAGKPVGLLAKTATCWRTQSTCWRTQSRVGVQRRMTANTARLHAFTSACVHTATAARMLSGETAFIDGSFRK